MDATAVLATTIQYAQIIKQSSVVKSAVIRPSGTCVAALALFQNDLCLEVVKKKKISKHGDE